MNKLADYFNSSVAKKAVCVGAITLGGAGLSAGFYAATQGAVVIGLVGGLLGASGAIDGLIGLRKLASSRTPS